MSAGYPWVALPSEAVEKIEGAERSSGRLLFHANDWNNMYVAQKVETSKDLWLPVTVPPEYAALRYQGGTVAGQWVRMTGSDINIRHRATIARGRGVGFGFDEFKKLVPEVRQPSGTNNGLLVTHVPDMPEDWIKTGATEFSAWLTTRDFVTPMPVAVEPETGLAQLDGHWPVDEVLDFKVAVVGVGSIGGVVADALARYGVGELHLIDPDRFLWHNMIRHVLGPESVGIMKVDAMKQRLSARWPDTDVHPYTYDVVNQAHLMRSLFSNVDIIVCAADGVAPRRVVSHLARRAGKPAVLACVLDDGAVGEIVRLQPAPRHGCLMCLRAHLAAGGCIDVEAAQELDYGTGSVHRAMTAVGPDLHFVGQLAAKAAISTLLETHLGDHTARLPGELATIGLRPTGDLAAPFDLARTMDVAWHDIPQPRPVCPTCNPGT